MCYLLNKLVKKIMILIKTCELNMFLQLDNVHVTCFLFLYSEAQSILVMRKKAPFYFHK